MNKIALRSLSSIYICPCWTKEAEIIGWPFNLRSWRQECMGFGRHLQSGIQIPLQPCLSWKSSQIATCVCLIYAHIEIYIEHKGFKKVEPSFERRVCWDLFAYLIRSLVLITMNHFWICYISLSARTSLLSFHFRQEMYLTYFQSALHFKWLLALLVATTLIK